MRGSRQRESCSRGHPYVDGSFDMQFTGAGREYRRCRICNAARAKAWRAVHGRELASRPDRTATTVIGLQKPDWLRAELAEARASVKAGRALMTGAEFATAELTTRLEAPSGLDEFEAHVMLANAPAVCLIDRDKFRELLRYIRRLERLVARQADALLQDG
jgi:hypothetical protein